MSRFVFSYLLSFTLLLCATPGTAADPDAAPPASRDSLHADGLPEAEWSFTLDTGTMAATSLKGQWGNLTETEQEQFTGLMAQLIYYAFQRFKRELTAFEVTMIAEERRPDGWFVRRFSGRPRDPKDLPLDYIFVFSRDERGHCELKDWVRDEASMVKLYRVQFLKVLRNEGFPVLLEKMRAKIERDRATLVPPAS